MKLERYDAIIIGGGVNGSAITYNLAKRGKKVILLEKERLASQASSAAAGMIAAQTELDEDGPLFQLARKSRMMFGSLATELKKHSGIDIELINKGMYKVASTLEEEDELKKIIQIQNRLGEDAEWLSGSDLRLKEPALSNDVLGAMYVQMDGQVSAPKLTQAYAKSAAVLGAEIREFVDVYKINDENGVITGVATNEGTFASENVIVSTGAWSKRLLQNSGVEIEVYPVKGECFSVTAHHPIISSPIFSHGCYLVPKQGGRLIVGATVKPYTFNKKVTIDGISTLMEKAKRLVPSIVEAEWEKAWAGIRPQTGDGLPYLGEHPYIRGLFIATGHFRNGILLAPITGELLADFVERRPIDEKFVEAFQIERTLKTIV
ncbi:glycine oxidase ThiO [Cytobacillus sp. S13-E01]|uniref:glycine oxidase ThiO n=1 Tax=Cytobacillus sp. S13-E01 TaxID=3031326 RepID=UPI0023D86024|nr:glycine oxidase ThiO [Cytobacillus sp. S13-E01]MDF0726863.1 glycine oxidase ThiO [Cytobacillus sp. S13-E01]